MVKNYELNWARTHAGLTQAEAAEKMGVSRVTFTRWETGAVDMPPARWARFLKVVELTANDIPVDAEPEVPKYIDGELSTPYLPMRLQKTAYADWPAADKKQWAKSVEEDADGLRAAWKKDQWDGYDHDGNLEDRSVNLEWVKNGWGYLDQVGKFRLTPAGKIYDKLQFVDIEDLI